MCHNVSVSKQPGQNLPNITAYLYFHVTQFPLSSPDCFWPGLKLYSTIYLMLMIRLGLTKLSVTRNRRDLWEEEMRKLSRESLPHVTNLAWHEGMSRDKVTGADPCRELRARGGWPGNCLTRSRPGQCQARGVGADKILMEIDKKLKIILVLCLAFHSSICSRGCKCFNDLIPDDLWHCLLPLEGLSPIPVTDDATHTSWQWQPFYHLQWTFHIFVPPLCSTWTTKLACFALFCIMWYLRPYFMLTKTLPAINWIFSPLETFHRYTSTNIHLSRKVSYKFHD